MKESSHLPLHTCRIIEPVATLNRLQFLLHFTAASAVLYYHASRLISALHVDPISPTSVSLMVIFLADVAFFFIWILAQAFRYRPVSRTVFPERLPEDGVLPHVDVFIMTADPDKEPTIGVMNTVLSVMALDYPPDKLHVYLSDDAGSDLTLCATKEAYAFARSWVPFCKTFGVDVRCPEVFFGDSTIYSQENAKEFVREKQKIELMYAMFKKKVEKLKEEKDRINRFQKTRLDHPAEIEIIGGDESNSTRSDCLTVPSLVYVSREKKKGVPHHFKAGALNVLLRVSSVITNSPYILELDCDMYSNDTSSVRQAMCFHLDTKLSPRLAFVQFPQMYYNISKNDIYAGELRQVFKDFWFGLDGLRGPILSGTNLFLKRRALYGAKPGVDTSNGDAEFSAMDIATLRHNFGKSNELCLTLVEKGSNDVQERIRTSVNSQKENILALASCEYENDTQWGAQVGFMYGSVVEDYFTGFHLHCRGWISTYLYPSKPAFLGTVPTNLSDALVQNKRWGAGLFEVGLSKHCPLIFGVSKNFSSVLQSMCYAYLAFVPVLSFPLLCYGILPQLCFLNGISLLPEVSSPWFGAFAFVFFSSSIQHLSEVLRSGRNITTWRNEQRFWMLNGVTGYLFASVDVFLKVIGVGAVNFDLTDKTAEENQIKRYKNGVFDFEGCSLILLPATTLSLLNIGALIVGAWRMIKLNAVKGLFAQFFLLCFVAMLSLPLLEGLIVRRDAGRVPPRIALWSLVLSGLIIYVFY